MALSSYEKELLEIVFSRVAGSDNGSVIDNAVRQILKEKKDCEPGRWGYLKNLLTRRVLRINRQAKKQGTRPQLVLTA